jgi:5-methylcytosine-specific restriction endonuclease McrA
MIEEMEQGKTCAKCGEWKPFEGFHKNKRMKDGLNQYCKKCRKQYHQEKAEQIKEYKKQYHQENKEQIKERKKQYYQENAEQIKERKKQYYQENAEQIIEQQKQYYQENIEKIKQYRQENAEQIEEQRKRYSQTEKRKESMYRGYLKRKSYKHKVNFTPHERKQILERDNWRCCNCEIKVHDRRIGDWNTPDKAHIDHIMPISKGGNSEPSNLQTLCRTCNLSKQDKVELQLELF